MRSKRNFGKLDQILRIGIGLILIYFGFFSGGVISDKLLAALVGVFGIVNVVVGLIGTCPVYFLACVCTCPEIASKDANTPVE